MSAIQPYITDVSAKRQALQAATQSGDTAAIGAATLALKASEAALKNQESINQQALLAVLTPAQAQVVKDYEAIAKSGGLGPLGGGGRGFGPGPRGH